MPNHKTKVVIVGGGCAGVTAAFELTATQELRDRFDVCLYTLGWRLGGKGASGRNRGLHCRIEEHGLHVWFGFYDNSFDVIEQAYAQMPKPSNPLFHTSQDAFHACDNILLWDECPPKSGKWKPVKAKLPALPALPGFSGGIAWRMLLVSLGVLDDEGTPLIAEHEEAAREAGLFEPHPLVPYAFDVLMRLAAEHKEVSALEGFDKLAEPAGETWELLPLARALAEVRATSEGLAAPELEHERLVVDMLLALRDPWGRFSKLLADAVCTARLVYMGIDLVHAMWDGIVADVFPNGTFDHLDDEELTAWLQSHGMSNFTAQNAPWLRGFYDLVFGFEAGDWTRPNLAAGAAIKSMLQIAFNSEGTLMWKMNAGMGDVVFSPLYRVLRERGVKVHFFHRARELRLSADGRRIEEIDLQPQARLHASVAEYDPFVPEIPEWPCWPSAPLWDQLDKGPELEQVLLAAQTTLEDEEFDSALPDTTLRHGTDFDHVVLAVSAPSLLPLCQALYDDGANPGFQAMVDNSFSVATQACQLWFKQSLADLGWTHGDDPISSAYLEPLDTYSDMSHLVPCERWQGGVGSIAYFCGPLPDSDAPNRHTARANAHAFALANTDRLRHFFPNAFDAGGFKFSALATPAFYTGPDPFSMQYVRANHVGSERYVTTPAGTVKHRLRPDQSGYENLFLAGDWTRTGLDGGCVEAAVISGRRAAQAITGIDVVIGNVNPFPPFPPP